MIDKRTEEVNRGGQFWIGGFDGRRRAGSGWASAMGVECTADIAVEHYESDCIKQCYPPLLRNADHRPRSSSAANEGWAPTRADRPVAGASGRANEPGIADICPRLCLALGAKQGLSVSVHKSPHICNFVLLGASNIMNGTDGVPGQLSYRGEHVCLVPAGNERSRL